MVPGAIFVLAMALAWRRLAWYATSSTMLGLAASIEPVSQSHTNGHYCVSDSIAKDNIL